jgi:S1-C subfamily serine protease
VRILASRADASTTTTRWTVTGLGFLVDARGYVLTHYDVVRDAKGLVALLADGRRFTVTRVWWNESARVAVLKIEGQELSALALGVSGSVRVGDAAVIVGWPASGQGFASAAVSATGAATGGDLVFNVPVGTENVGGPVVNAQGQVVGIASSGARGGDWNLTGGYAIPIDRAKGMLEHAGLVVAPRSAAPSSP